MIKFLNVPGTVRLQHKQHVLLQMTQRPYSYKPDVKNNIICLQYGKLRHSES